MLDIVNIPLLGPKPGPHQPENWLLDPEYYWEKVGKYPVEHLGQLVDETAPLWMNGHSTFHGGNDFIPVKVAPAADGSLRFIEVTDLHLAVFKPSEAFGNLKRKVQARFTHADDEYRLWVTDPYVERKYLQFPDGNHALGHRFLTVSLGESYEERCYKFVAAVIGE